MGALFFDSPALAMGSVVSYRGAELGYPGIVLGLGKWLAQVRFDLDWDAMDYTSAIDNITMPALMLHSKEDGTTVYDQMAGRPRDRAAHQGQPRPSTVLVRWLATGLLSVAALKWAPRRSGRGFDTSQTSPR